MDEQKARERLNKRDEYFSKFWSKGTSYNQLIEEEDIPVHDGFYIQDARTVEVGEWKRTGGKGAIVNLFGNEGLNDIHIHELPPRASLDRMNPLFEQIVYVLEGQGSTRIYHDDKERVFEWNEDSMFFLPRNTTYEHVNLGDRPARLVVDTDLPTLCRLFRSQEMIFENETEFTSLDDSDFSGDGTITPVEGFPAAWDANFIPDIAKFDELQRDEMWGVGNHIKLRFPEARTLRAHISDLPVGTYKKCHRHSAGSTLMIVEGEGYTLMAPGSSSEYNEASERMRIDWQRGTLMVPPTMWWHQHFNLSSGSARTVAVYAPNVIPRGPNILFDPKTPDNNIQYHEEDPAIRELYASELSERGLELQMPEEAYEDTESEFNMNYEPYTEEE